MTEKLSALMDSALDDLDERRTLRALADDLELRGTWERYHLIRAAMTRQLSVLAEPGLPQRVLARLDAPGERMAQAPLRFWPLAGGFAAAASVAAIAIVALQVIQEPSDPVAPVAVAAKANPIASNATSIPAANDSEERLYLYLVGHNEFMPIAGIGGMLPYARVVAHTQDK